MLLDCWLGTILGEFKIEICEMNQNKNLQEVILLFLKLGTTAFGGPAAHIAMMHNEVVEKRKWLTEEDFLDLLGATNLIPGPNSTEMAIHLSYQRAGLLGLVLGGASFILPAMIIVGLLAWAYVQFGAFPEVDWLLNGIKPVVIAIIVSALFTLGRKAVKGHATAVIGAASLVLAFLGINPLLVLLAAGAAGVLIVTAQRLTEKPSSGNLSAWLLPLGGLQAMPFALQDIDLSELFLIFLKIGSVLYGSGYVLLAFLRTDLVVNFGWLSNQQLLDAVAIGQVTPGPVFTTATFIGYVLGGMPGALLATLGIFLPSFVFVALSNRVIPHMRRSPWVGAFLDGVNVAALGLMASVTWELGRTLLVDLVSFLSGLLAYVLLVRYKVNTTYLIAGGALLGFLAEKF
jgi:chromate transporter